MRRLSAASLILLIVIVSAIYLPMGYRRLFIPDIERTHLLFSPVTGKFLYCEQLTGVIPDEVRSKAEDHHSEIAYGDQDGVYYDRLAFERMLPFIYTKNMQLLGLLPVRIEGQTFDSNAIKAARQALEMTPDMFPENSTRPPVWPLLESDSGEARLVFPEDVFRMTDREMEFVNVDTNLVDLDLTEKFTNALKERGFVFPARSVNTRVTILKPFDEGAFIVDHDYNVFHVKRAKGEPKVVKTPIDQGIKTRFIMVSESLRRVYHGILLGEDGRAYLLGYDDYRVIPLPLDGYDPDGMDLKILTDPLHVTATWSDETTIHGLAMDLSYSPIASFSHVMSRASDTEAKRIYRALFPFSIMMDDPRGGKMSLSLEIGNKAAAVGIGLALTALVASAFFAKRRSPRLYEIIVVALCGIYGLIAVAMVDQDF